MRASKRMCAKPRSASTLLCEGLKATDVAGRPEEYFETLPTSGCPRTPADYLAGLDDPAALTVVNGAPPPEPYASLLDVDRHEEHLERVRAS